MISYRLTSIIIGVILFFIIVFLVRRGKLQEKHSLVWFGIGIVTVILSIFPRLLDRISGLLGIEYAPTLLFVLAVGILLILNLYLFIFASQNEIRIKELIQQVAVLNSLIEQPSDESDSNSPTSKNSPAD